MGNGVDNVGSSSPQAYVAADPLDVATAILARDPESPNLLRAARSSAAELEAIESPTTEQLATLAQINGLIAQLAPPETPEASKTWAATGAVKAKAVVAPPPNKAPAPPPNPAVAKFVGELKKEADLDGATSIAGLKTAGMASDQLATHGEAVPACRCRWRCGSWR